MDGEVSRRGLLAGGVAALLVAGCGDAEEPPRTPDGGAATAPGDVAILEFALTLEYFESDFYDRLLQAGILAGGDREMVRLIARDERAHVDALEQAIRGAGGDPPQRPEPDYEKLLAGGAEAILERAAGIEDLGAAAYLGQAAGLQGEEYLASALSIHSVEARHAAALNYRVGRSFLPNGALAAPLSRDEVLAQATEFFA